MKSCKSIQHDFIEALYGELDPQRQQTFEQHLHGCSECADQFSSLRLTLEAMDEREITEPDPAFWDEFGKQVREMAARSDERSHAGRLLQSRRWADAAPPRRLLWAGRVAAGIAILALGVAVGRLSVRPEDPQLTRSPSPDTALNQRVNQYMEQSRTLLLGIVNLDPAANGFEALDLTPYQQVSNQLVQQAPQLERELDSAGEKRLARLVLELEEMLNQIAALDSAGAVEGVRTVRDGVQQRALLFKIHLESTRRQKKTQPTVSPRRL